MTDDLAHIFTEGAQAAVGNDGLGVWTNPYLEPWLEAKRIGKDVDYWRQKVNAWEEGWEWQVARHPKEERLFDQIDTP